MTSVVSYKKKKGKFKKIPIGLLTMEKMLKKIFNEWNKNFIRHNKGK